MPEHHDRLMGASRLIHSRVMSAFPQSRRAILNILCRNTALVQTLLKGGTLTITW